MKRDAVSGFLALLALATITAAVLFGIIWASSVHRCERLEAAYPQYRFRIHKGNCEIEIGDGVWMSTYDRALALPALEKP